MCNKIIRFVNKLTKRKESKQLDLKKNSSAKLEREKSRKQFYDDMETGVMDDDF